MRTILKIMSVSTLLCRKHKTRVDVVAIPDQAKIICARSTPQDVHILPSTDHEIIIRKITLDTLRLQGKSEQKSICAIVQLSLSRDPSRFLPFHSFSTPVKFSKLGPSLQGEQWRCELLVDHHDGGKLQNVEKPA